MNCMAQCTAPVRGHSSAAAVEACPACRYRRGGYGYGGYEGRTSYSPSYSSSGSSGGGGYSGGGRGRWWSQCKAALVASRVVSGYAPACLNEWAAGICHKPRIKCADCEHRSLASITNPVIYDHLAGEHTVGIYPLLHDNTCYFLAVDFDEQEWREDALAFVESCRTVGGPAALGGSRSGGGGHGWLFFLQKVDARDVRRLGTALISHVCARTRQLKLSSYDRLFPNQDTMPKGGFGNLIALPLQKKPRVLCLAQQTGSDPAARKPAAPSPDSRP